MHVRFLREFARKPSAVGAIAPSSRWLARAMTDESGLDDANCVVEIGPGTGAFTAEIQRRMRPGARLIVVENSAGMAAAFRERYPAVHLHETSAENLPSILSAEGVAQTDCILSGLPWAAFDDALQDRLLDAIMRALRPGGHFATFAYLQGLLMPAGRRFRRKLSSVFSSVSRSPTVWCNLPPAFVYRCSK